ncbi:hypothetical protein [Xanthomonas vesicatoria]|uniref:hypothetical protein n=1 Tax=Xanthomonas vesicatoria TaxID=56460 RepID=UPI001E4D3DD9|nr:hypothetical protein [Xanthomonas vesicatoria]MCC8619121.1 hypothetical protein [Xanthomonas vesicatoria]
MTDGSHSFKFQPPQVSCLRPSEIVLDLFAGGDAHQFQRVQQAWDAYQQERTNG